MSKRTAIITAALCLTLSSLVAACHFHDHDDDHDHVHTGKRSGATCPTTNAPNYENFGRAFVTTYCVRCHSSTLKGAARNGAAKGHDFDSESGVLAWIDHVDVHAAAGPNAINDEMPPSAPFPTVEERQKLGQWLACALGSPDGGTAPASGDASAD